MPGAVSAWQANGGLHGFISEAHVPLGGDLRCDRAHPAVSAFQGVFWVIGGDPVRYRALMPWAIAEKFVFGLPALALFLIGVTPREIALFAAIDLMLGIGFMIAWQRTPETSS